MIEQVKNTEQARSEYRFISGFEMDTHHYGRQEGMIQGMQAGIAQGAYQTKLETVKILKQFGDSVQKIVQATSLSLEERKKL